MGTGSSAMERVTSASGQIADAFALMRASRMSGGTYDGLLDGLAHGMTPDGAKELTQEMAERLNPAVFRSTVYAKTGYLVPRGGSAAFRKLLASEFKDSFEMVPEAAIDRRRSHADFEVDRVGEDNILDRNQYWKERQRAIKNMRDKTAIGETGVDVLNSGMNDNPHLNAIAQENLALQRRLLNLLEGWFRTSPAGGGRRKAQP
jgi:hypothetical protein